jgi:hypothetical protein
MQDLWRACRRLRATFLQTYISFQHFQSKVCILCLRESTLRHPSMHSFTCFSAVHFQMHDCKALFAYGQGWVVRPGPQYGMDFVLYSKHPSEAHSSFCVRCQLGDQRLSWVDLEAANRVSAQASPHALLLRKPSMDMLMVLDPKCEMTLSRSTAHDATACCMPRACCLWRLIPTLHAPCSFC